MRKLLLYSDQDVPETERIDQELVALLDKPVPTIGYIPSTAASQFKYEYYEGRRAYYARLGISLTVLFGLDHGYDANLLEALLKCDAIHLTGGNTYYFLRWLRERDMLTPLRQYVEHGGVLIGVSAGAILMTPDISTSALCGDEPIEGENDTAALNLVDFAFVPHFGEIPSDLAVIEEYSRVHQIDVYACKGNEGLVVVDNQVKCIGDVTVVRRKI